MVIGKFLLLALVFCVGALSQRPSSAEFNLFCKLLTEANNIMHGPGYVYDEDKDQEIVKEMHVLFNATTSNMNDFGNSLWDTKEFLKEHPPPTDPKNREEAHSEIGKLIDKGEKKIQDSRDLAKQANEKIEAAKLLLAQGIYGENVTEVPRVDGNFTEILNKPESIFNHHDRPGESCGKDKPAGKTLINDLFCVCVGDAQDAQGPCHQNIWSSRSWSGNSHGAWKKIKFGPANPELISSFGESFEKIEQLCREEMTENKVKSESIPALLEQYVSLIGKGDDQVKKDKNNKKIFGHSTRSKNRGDVTTCDGSQGSSGNPDDPEKNNEKTCVDYAKNYNGKTYDIPWHNKFREASGKLKNAKQLEDQILKNRADLLLLKSEAWLAYNRESDDETSNLDDMNVSHLFDASDKKDTMAENKQGEPTNQEREYIDVPSQSTQGSQPSQPAPSNKDGRKYHYISSTEATQEEAPAAPAGGGDPPYIYVSSTGTPSQQTPAPETPSPTQQDPPTQSAKRLRDEKKTGE